MQNLIAMNSYTTEQIQYMFLSALHHDHRDGKTLLRVISDHTAALNKYENNLKHLIGFDVPGNVYVSVNDFKDERMTPYCLNAMFFDLDGHEFKSKRDLERAKQNTYNLLNQAVTDGILSRWSICNDSGRGLQLFYILDRSIKVSENTRNMINFFYATYRDMTILLKEILDAYDGITLSVDDGVKDMQRVCRMPETYNLKENARCKCVMKEFNTDETGKFVTYTLNEMAIMSGYDEYQRTRYKEDTAHRRDAYLKRKESAANKTDEEKEMFLKRRLRQLEEIQTYRDDWTGHRQVFCFIYYNTALQVMSQKDAINALEQFNENFGNGIESKQIRNIISEFRKRNGVPYKFKNTQIIDTLGLSRNEVSRSDLLVSNERKEQKEKMMDYKAKRDELVVSLICAGQKYETIVDTVNETFKEEGKSVSLRTVKNIAKRYDCGSRNGSVKDVTDVDCYDKSYKTIEKETENDDDFFECNESAKNVMYNGVVINTCNNTHIEPIDGICFDIEIEDDETETAVTNVADGIFATGKYDYGMSFLTYLRNNIDETYFINIINTFMNELYECENTATIHDAMKIVEHLASCYEVNPELHVAVFDLETLTRGVKRNHLAPKIHGVSVGLTEIVREHERPITYIPKKSIIDTLGLLKQELFEAMIMYSENNVNDIMEQIDVTIDELVRISKYKTKWLRCGNTGMNMSVFLDMVRNLTVADLLHITSKAIGRDCGVMFYVSEVNKATYKHCNNKDLNKIDKLMKKILPQKCMKQKVVKELEFV